MIIAPKTRGFICTTAHPTGCERNVRNAASYSKEHLETSILKRVLVIGASTGYGLATRIAATFGGKSDTVGVFFERESDGKRTATAGYYNNLAFEKLAKESGSRFASINGDAYSAEIKEDTISAIKSTMIGGKVDLIVYSLAAPKRKDHNGVVHSSVIKPIGQSYSNKTVDFHSGQVSDITVEPATKEEIDGTVAVMGGEDWLLWIKALKAADAIAENAVTVAFSYLGPELTHPIYKDGTIGAAKMDLEKKASEITNILSPSGGKAFVSVNKALVTQASSAIPVVPLYISILYKLMKGDGTHEGCIEQAVRLLDRIYPADNLGSVLTDKEGRIRLDDWEMRTEIQSQIAQLWKEVDSDNIEQLSDLAGYREEFFSLFGFGVEGVDYNQDIEIKL